MAPVKIRLSEAIDDEPSSDCGRQVMKNAEKIEALREWLGNRHSSCRCMICIELLDPIRDIIDPPRAKWRQMVNEEAEKSLIGTPIGAVLYHLSHVANPSEYDAAFELANIVAVCEKRWVDDGWQADPDRVPVGHWGISWLLVPLSQETPAWHVLGDRAAAWLRSLTDGGAA